MLTKVFKIKKVKITVFNPPISGEVRWGRQVWGDWNNFKTNQYKILFRFMVFADFENLYGILYKYNKMNKSICYIIKN